MNKEQELRSYLFPPERELTNSQRLNEFLEKRKLEAPENFLAESPDPIPAFTKEYVAALEQKIETRQERARGIYFSWPRRAGKNTFRKEMDKKRNGIQNG